MLAPNIRHPKEVTVRVLKAENLRVAPRSDHKQKKVSHKWKVVVLGGKKKVTSEAVFAPDGNPIWNFETTIKIATRGDPVVLLIADSEDNHAGQVVVSGAAIPPKITDSSVGPTDSSRLCIMDMEQTKKTEVGFGRLYFWIWVEEYRSEESKSKSSRGSVLSLSSLHHKDKASIPNSLNYSGSVISLSSNHGDSKDKKSWYKKKASQALHAAASLSSARSPVIPVSNKKTVISGYNPFDYYLQSPHDDVGVIDEKDGSVLGAYSELTGSDFNPLARQSLHFTNDKPINPSSPLSTVSQSIHPQPPPSEQNGKLLSSNIVDNSLDINEPSKPRPELIRIAPKCGPSSGGTELTVYCRSLTNKNMQGASVFVDDHEVSRQDWVFQESDQPDRSQLRIHMPALPAGRYPICVNTSEFGQIRCKQEFTYLQSNTNPVSSPASSLFDSSMNESSNNKPITITPKSKNIDANGGVIFNRTGSQTSNLILVDRRSGRRDRIKRPEVLGRSDSLSSSTLEVSSHMEAKNNPGNAALVINSNVNGGLNKNQGKLVVTNSNDSPVYDETIKSPVTIKVSKAIHSEPTHFIRVGSQKSELLLQDRRSKRGNRRLPVKMVGNDAEEVDSSSHDLQKLNSTSIVSSTKSTNDTNFMDNQLFLNKPEKNIVKTEISSPDLLSEASQFNPLSDTYDISTPLSLCEEFSDQLTESQMNYSSTINGKMMSSEVLPPLTKTPLTYGNFSDSIDEVHTCSTTQKSSDHFGTLINEQRDTISANAGWKEKGEEKEEEAYLSFSNTTHDRESFVSQKGRPTGESELGGSTLNSPDTMPKTLPPFKRNELNKQDSFSKIRNNTKESSLLKVNNTNKINQQVNKTPKHSSSTLEPLSNLHNQLNEDTELETTSAMSADTNQTVEFNELSKRHRSSDRSAASGRSKSIMGAVEDESLRLENEALRSMLNDANHLISTIKSHTLTLETQLSEKANDIDRLSRELCNLRNRLLIDGLTQYLERA